MVHNSSRTRKTRIWLFFFCISPFFEPLQGKDLSTLFLSLFAYGNVILGFFKEWFGFLPFNIVFPSSIL